MTATAERIDIRFPLLNLCDRLGLDDYESVAELRVTPRLVTAEVYLRNADGAKYIDPETGTAAVETRTFEVNT